MKRMMYSFAALVLCAPLAAQAAEGWVVDDISLQAGPDPAYPSIVELNAGTPVSIQGCIEAWTWCDVVAGGDRGWVPGTFLEEDYGGQRVVVIDYGPRIGIPVVNFSLGLYWDQHYHNRPFYTQREQWVSRAIRPTQPQRPAKAVARTTQPQGAPAATTTTRSAATSTQQQSTRQSISTTQQPQTQAPRKPTQMPQQQTQQSRMTARATAPKAPETAPETQKPSQASQAEKRESAQAPTTVAKAKPRAGEPKPNDELKKQPKPKDDKTDQGGNDREH
jgi:uncharacterized protein YraI